MNATVSIHQAKTHFSKLIERARQGEEIVIAKAGEPVARLVPEARPGKRRKLGTARGRIWIAENFDDPLPDDLLDLFEDKAGNASWTLTRSSGRLPNPHVCRIGFGAGLRTAITKPGSALPASGKSRSKTGVGRLRLPSDLGGFLARQLTASNFQLLPIALEHAVAVRDLPLHHRAPFDRLLVAQCLAERLALVSGDPRMSAYQVEVLW